MHRALRARLALRGLAILLAAIGLLAVRPAPARAAVTGDCTVTATADSTGPVDVATTDVWHLQSSDQISVAATSGSAQTAASGYVSAFGFEIPVANATSSGDLSMSSDVADASLLATLGRVFVLSGSSAGPGGGCSASIEIVLDDVSPFTTVLGIAGTVGVALGLLGLVRGIRSPGRRVISGLVGLGLFAAGLSLLLQQTSTPGAVAAAVASSPWAASVPSPADFVVEPMFLAWSAVLTLGVVFLLPFPADLFNQTLEHNGARIRAGLRRFPLVGRLVAAEPAATAPVTLRQNPLVVVAFLLLAGALYGFLSPSFAPDEASLLTFAGIVVALVAETWLTYVPFRAVHRIRTGEVGVLRVVPATLLVAAACVAISRAAGFQPGYLYGLLLGYAFAKRLPVADDGRAAAAGAAWLLGLGLVSWFGLGAIRGAGIEPSIARSIAAAIFASLVVAGLQGVAFGMVPLRFLHGEPLFKWNRLRWAVLYVPGLLAFSLVILNPSNGFIGGSQTPFLITVALFIGFAALSIAFWAWFRFRPSATAEAADSIETETAALP